MTTEEMEKDMKDQVAQLKKELNDPSIPRKINQNYAALNKVKIEES